VKDSGTNRLAKLEEQQKELADKIKQERAKLKKEERQRDTKRKTILGALMLDHYTENPDVKKWVDALLENNLVGNDNRVLFGLEPKQDAPETSAQNETDSGHSPNG
jgi:hypothetical protein